MARSDEERLTHLELIRDAIDDALFASASTADVVSYSIEGRSVSRSRMDAINTLNDINKQIAQLKLAVHGRARNLLWLRRDK